jgi:hypothetical protein
VYFVPSSHQWWVTYGGGQADEAAVRALVEQGKIHSVYSTCPNDAYHIGKTYDMKASRFTKRDRMVVYTDGTRA